MVQGEDRGEIESGEKEQRKTQSEKTADSSHNRHAERSRGGRRRPYGYEQPQRSVKGLFEYLLYEDDAEDLRQRGRDKKGISDADQSIEVGQNPRQRQHGYRLSQLERR